MVTVRRSQFEEKNVQRTTVNDQKNLKWRRYGQCDEVDAVRQKFEAAEWFKF